MGSSIYQIAPQLPRLGGGSPGCELVEMTRALYHARELAMNRMEEEAEALGADGIVGMRLTVSLSTNPIRMQWALYREWQAWARKTGFPPQSTDLAQNWARWPQIANAQWT